MPWNKNDYPDSFKNLEPDVRNKAIEIANALLREGNDEGRAISIATAKAREYVHGDILIARHMKQKHGMRTGFS